MTHDHDPAGPLGEAGARLRAPEQIADGRVSCQLKLKLRPSQERELLRWLHRLTGAWNWTIRKIEADSRVGIRYSKFDILPVVNGHGAKIGVPQCAVAGVVGDAWMAWQRCFQGVSKRPRMKSRRNKLNGIAFPHGKDLHVESDRVRVPCIGRLRFHTQDIPTGHVGSARIVRRASGWYLRLVIQADVKPIRPVADEAVGIDPGFSRLLTMSTGEIVEHPDELRSGEHRLGQAQRGCRRRLTARLLERQANRRKDRNHKLSRRLVSENALIAWSKDRHSNIAHKFGKSVTSASHYQLRQMLAYKSRSGGREFVEVVSRNSTRTCSACRARMGPSGWAGLKVRQWTCGHCGTVHDRDVNAAINTLAGAGAALERAREGAPGIATKVKRRSSSSQPPSLSVVSKEN
jgi:putative transposase